MIRNLSNAKDFKQSSKRFDRDSSIFEQLFLSKNFSFDGRVITEKWIDRGKETLSDFLIISLDLLKQVAVRLKKTFDCSNIFSQFFCILTHSDSSCSPHLVRKAIQALAIMLRVQAVLKDYKGVLCVHSLADWAALNALASLRDSARVWLSISRAPFAAPRVIGLGCESSLSLNE